MPGKIWSDATSQSDRFDLDSKDGNDRFEGLDLFKQKIAYDIFEDKRCGNHTLDRSFEPFFGWVSKAKKTGSCKGPKTDLGSEYELRDG